MTANEPPRRSSDPSMPSESERSPDQRARERAEREAELKKAIGHTVAGRYRITELLGIGGMGAVYEAEHLGIGKKVALKFVDSEWLREGLVASRFAREARAASAVESDHIVTVFDAGTDGDRPFLVMELLRGEDLGARLRREGKIDREVVLEILAQTLRGLADAHEAGIVHRDLKPDNVFLVQKPGGAIHVKLVDFGVSKIERLGSGTAPLALTQKGMVLGTPLYMAPEQAQAFEDVDARADLFSAGAILFECLAGRPPHVGATYEQIIMSICMNEAPDLKKIDPQIPTVLSRFVARALAKDRAKRFGSARQMLVGLSELRAVLRDGVSSGNVQSAPKVKPVSAPTLLSEGARDLATPEKVRVHESDSRARAATPAASPRQAPSTDATWSSGSRKRVALPDVSRVNPKQLVWIGLAAAAAGAIATVVLVSALRGPHDEQAKNTTSDSTALASSAAPITSTSGGVAAPAAIAPLGSGVSAVMPAKAAVAPAIATPAPAAAFDAGARSLRPAAKKPTKGGDLELQRDFP